MLGGVRMLALTEGVHDGIAAQVYHGDPCPEPSLSSSIGRLIVDETPRHAWLAHPRLNPRFVPQQKTEFDIGTAAHDLLLEGEERMVVIAANSFRTKAAREARDAAYAEGKTPLLVDRVNSVRAMVASARAQLEHHEDARGAFENGKPEQTLVWREGPIWCRARLDWLPIGGNVFFDYKSTGGSANPDEWVKRAYDTGVDFQDAFYRRGIRAALGIEGAQMRFVVQETEPPHALTVCAFTPYARELADRKVEEALGWWAWCTKHGRWPGYPKRTAWLEPPVYHDKLWTEREQRRVIAADAGEDLRQLAIEWQAPFDKEEAHAD